MVQKNDSLLIIYSLANNVTPITFNSQIKIVIRQLISSSQAKVIFMLITLN